MVKVLLWIQNFSETRPKTRPKFFQARKSPYKIRANYKMVGKTGFEPATPWSQTKCSTKLSHFPIISGALEGIRTPDLLVRSQTLYPAELRAQNVKSKWWLRLESNQ